jgi:hypothetical protein
VTATELASGSLIAALPSVIAVAISLCGSLWIVVRRPGLGMIFFFVLFAFAWRLTSVLYLDLFGPIFSDQLVQELGPGKAAVPVAISQGLVVIALLYSFRRERVRHLIDASQLKLGGRLLPGGISFSNLALLAATLFVAGLLVELLVRGPIPLFAGIERFDYTRLYGGPLHLRLLEWGPMLAFQLGIFFAVPMLHDRPVDWRFSALFGTLLVYLFLAGHRFSSLYVYSSFFVMPIGAVLAVRRETSPHGATTSRRVLWYLTAAGGVLLVLIAVAVAYSYIVVRGEGAALLAKLSERVLVQQGEMWWLTYDRVFLHGDWNGKYAAYKLFVDPFDPSRNSTMQFLMEQALPLQRAHHILAQGSAYTGGWPEVFFELGGPIGGFFLVGLSAIVFSEFMFLLTRCVVQERFVTCVFLTPILFALSITVVSGMVNSFIQVTFLIKITVALLVYVAEDRWRSSLFLSRSSADTGKEA